MHTFISLFSPDDALTMTALPMVNDDDDEDANIERVRFRATRVCLSRCEEDIVRNTEEEEEKKGEKRGEEEEEKRI